MKWHCIASHPLHHDVSHSSRLKILHRHTMSYSYTTIVIHSINTAHALNRIADNYQSLKTCRLMLVNVVPSDSPFDFSASHRVWALLSSDSAAVNVLVMKDDNPPRPDTSLHRISSRFSAHTLMKLEEDDIESTHLWRERKCEWGKLYHFISSYWKKSYYIKYGQIRRLSIAINPVTYSFPQAPHSVTPPHLFRRQVGSAPPTTST